MSDIMQTCTMDFLGLPIDAQRNLFTVGGSWVTSTIWDISFSKCAPFVNQAQLSGKEDLVAPFWTYKNSSTCAGGEVKYTGLNQIAVDLRSSFNYDSYWMCPSFNESTAKNSEIKEEKKVIIKDRLITTKNLDGKAERLQKLLNKCRRRDQFIIFGRPKYSAKTTQHISTRSRYIGVTKNGKAWQALISINGRKTYLGTYEDQRKAAVAFDFHSILLKDFSAMTNFNYTKQNLYDMLSHFSSNNGEFDAESYISKFSPRNIN